MNLHDATQHKPAPGARVILVREGVVVPLMPVYETWMEHNGPFIRAEKHEQWVFPLDPKLGLTIAYNALYNLDPFIRPGDKWMPISDITPDTE